MKWIYIVSWCIITIAPNTPEMDKFGRTSLSITTELNYYTHCGNEMKFAFKEEAIKFYEEALCEDDLKDITLDSCQRQKQNIHGDIVWVDCFDFELDNSFIWVNYSDSLFFPTDETYYFDFN